MKELIVKLDEKKLDRITKALENITKEMEIIRKSKDKLLVIDKSKWYQFWKWDWSLFTDRPPCESYQPTIDRTTNPPR